MQIHLMPLLIPLLFVFIFWEWRLSKKKSQSIFRFESSVLNITCGVMERIFDLYFFYGLYLFFSWVQQEWGILNLSIHSVSAWLACIFLLDFLIYWFHRTSHRVNFLWGAHVTHHQCEEFNLTVAFRNSIFPHIFRTSFIIILPIIGFPAEMILGAITISGLWQFWIHTSMVGKLGLLEYLMMTPSSHRVHHACNKQYLDRNFGGMFIIWDRLFGTFEAENDAPVYGLTHPMKSLNPIKAYFHVWEDLFKASKATNSTAAKFKIWFGRPAEFYQQYEFSRAAHQSFLLSIGMVYYLINQLLMTTSLLLLLLVYNEFLSFNEHLVFCGFLILSSITLCLLMEQKQIGFRLEQLRLLVLSFAPMLMPGAIPWLFTFLAPLYLFWSIALKAELSHLN